MSPPAAGSVTECRAFAVVPNANVMSLAETLRGLCSKYSQLRMYEATLSIPGKNSTVKLLKRLRREPPRSNAFQEKLPDRWTMVWESDAARGPLYKELPVAVREVCESHCFCNNASEFWQSIGARFEYDMIKEGNEYICYHGGVEIRVHLMKILALAQPGNPEGPSRAVAEKYLVEVSTRVPEGKHLEGARAIGAFGGSLQPLVSLRKADRPMA